MADTKISAMPAATDLSGATLPIVQGAANKAAAISLFAAAQADLESASSTIVFTTPGRQQFHPSAAKAWIHYIYSAGTPTSQRNYNVASLTDNGTGDATINFTVAFSDAKYTFHGSAVVSTAAGGFLQGPASSAAPTASAFRVNSTNFAGSSNDVGFAYAAFFGDQ